MVIAKSLGVLGSIDYWEQGVSSGSKWVNGKKSLGAVAGETPAVPVKSFRWTERFVARITGGIGNHESNKTLAAPDYCGDRGCAGRRFRHGVLFQT